MTDPLDEHAVIRAAAAGSADALGRLYAAYADAVFTASFRILGNRADSEDVLQDVFVGLPRALAKYRETGSFIGWIRRVATRTALMRLRSRKRRRESNIDDLPLDFASPQATDSGVDRMALRHTLAQMPEPLRLVFMLKEIEGYTHDEVADLLGISAGASATRLSRAWEFLRMEIAR